jgi:hypothetical protein
MVALRALLEYPATRLLMPVTLDLPNDEAVCCDFYDGLGELPNNVTLARGTKPPDRRSHNVILPAFRIRDTGTAELIAEHLPVTPRSAGVERRELAFLAGAMSELTGNALRFAKSPVDVIASVALEKEEDEVQLVVADLGDRFARGDDVAVRLEEAWRTNESRGRQTPSGLQGIALSAHARHLEVSLGIYSGTGRLLCKSGHDPVFVTEQPFVPGFVAAVVLHRS